MRVSMSAIGSVIMAAILSPARLADARDQAVAGQVAETNAADTELPENRPRPAAQLAAQPHANLLPRLHLELGRVALVGIQQCQLAGELNSFRFDGHELFQSSYGLRFAFW